LSWSGVVQLFAGKPRHPIGVDGKMALSDHLRELRARVLKIAVIVVTGLVVALFFFELIFAFLAGPYEQAVEALPDGVTEGVIGGAGGPLLLYLKLCGIVAVVATSPLWLYQIWAFILPGLHAAERTWTRVFAAIAGPLFIAGVTVGYLTLPKGLEVLIGFTPAGLTNLVDFGDYLSFMTRTLLVFGIAFEIPVFIILLNLAGVLRASSLKAYRPWWVIGIFLFAAVATPSTDPFTMVFLALPMMALFFISEGVARIIDRRRDEQAVEGGWDDDEMSPL
jgi:sec-independent protein translocase protein TatC